MPPRRPSKKDSPAKVAGRMKRRWRVVLLRAKGEILGDVEAPDAAAAKVAAVARFDLDEVQRTRTSAGGDGGRRSPEYQAQIYTRRLRQPAKRPPPEWQGASYGRGRVGLPVRRPAAHAPVAHRPAA